MPVSSAFKVRASASNPANLGEPKKSVQPAPVPAVINRRRLMGMAGAIVVGSFIEAPQAEAIPLIPLGKISNVGPKQFGLPIEEVKQRIADDMSRGQTFTTGNVCAEVFADDCRFKDPVNNIVGLSRYITASKNLFDSSCSYVVLDDIKITGPRTIEAAWTIGGYLKLPWSPKVSPFSGRTFYTLNDAGLVELQEQIWEKTPEKAIVETFTPNFAPKVCVVPDSA